MERRDLFKGAAVISFGGLHFAKPEIEEAGSIRLCHAAINRGITFMDDSWNYNEGVSEKRMGTALSQGGYRDRAFLMTKVDGRTKQTARQQLDESLKRLRTDRIDLWQFHEVLRFDDPDRIFVQGDAIEAALEARQAPLHRLHRAQCPAASWTRTSAWAWRADLNRCICRPRRRAEGSAPSIRLLKRLLCRCPTWD